MRGVRSKLTFANVCSFLALLIAIGTGGAYAANTIGSRDVIDDSLRSADIRNNQLRGADTLNESLTGADIADQSGVNTCVASTIRLDELCFRAEDSARSWGAAIGHCASLGLRVPDYGEAIALTSRHDLPNVAEDEFFWTQQRYQRSDGVNVATAVSDGGFSFTGDLASSAETVCVTTPTN